MSRFKFTASAFIMAVAITSIGLFAGIKIVKETLSPTLALAETEQLCLGSNGCIDGFFDANEGVTKRVNGPSIFALPVVESVGAVAVSMECAATSKFGKLQNGDDTNSIYWTGEGTTATVNNGDEIPPNGYVIISNGRVPAVSVISDGGSSRVSLLCAN